jgi:hypothetical protein
MSDPKKVKKAAPAPAPDKRAVQKQQDDHALQGLARAGMGDVKASDRVLYENMNAGGPKTREARSTAAYARNVAAPFVKSWNDGPWLPFKADLDPSGPVTDELAARQQVMQVRDDRADVIKKLHEKFGPGVEIELDDSRLP